jgi:hypothetical protein
VVAVVTLMEQAAEQAATEPHLVLLAAVHLPKAKR